MTRVVFRVAVIGLSATQLMSCSGGDQGGRVSQIQPLSADRKAIALTLLQSVNVLKNTAESFDLLVHYSFLFPPEKFSAVSKRMSSIFLGTASAYCKTDGQPSSTAGTYSSPSKISGEKCPIQMTSHLIENGATKKVVSENFEILDDKLRSKNDVESMSATITINTSETPNKYDNTVSFTGEMKSQLVGTFFYYGKEEIHAENDVNSTKDLSVNLEMNLTLSNFSIQVKATSGEITPSRKNLVYTLNGEFLTDQEVIDAFGRTYL